MNNVYTLGKRVFTASVVTLTIVWSMGLAAMVPASVSAETCPTLEPGDLFTVPTSKAIYMISQSMGRQFFQHTSVFDTWFASKDAVQPISVTCGGAYHSDGFVPYRAGSTLVKNTTFPAVYAVLPGGELAHITSPEIAVALYGANWEDKIIDLSDQALDRYTDNGKKLDSATPHEGMLVKKSGESDVYMVEGGAYVKVEGALGTTTKDDVEEVSATVFETLSVSDTTMTNADVLSDVVSEKVAEQIKDDTTDTPDDTTDTPDDTTDTPDDTTDTPDDTTDTPDDTTDTPDDTTDTPDESLDLTVTLADNTPTTFSRGAADAEVVTLKLTAKGEDVELTQTALTAALNGQNWGTQNADGSIECHSLPAPYGGCDLYLLQLQAIDGFYYVENDSDTLISVSEPVAIDNWNPASLGWVNWAAANNEVDFYHSLGDVIPTTRDIEVGLIIKKGTTATLTLQAALDATYKTVFTGIGETMQFEFTGFDYKGRTSGETGSTAALQTPILTVVE